MKQCNCSVCEIARAKKIDRSDIDLFIHNNTANYEDLHFRDFEQGLDFVSVSYYNPSGKPVESDEGKYVEFFVYNDKNFKPVAWFSLEDASGYRAQ